MRLVPTHAANTRFSSALISIHGDLSLAEGLHLVVEKLVKETQISSLQYQRLGLRISGRPREPACQCKSRGRNTGRKTGANRGSRVFFTWTLSPTPSAVAEVLFVTPHPPEGANGLPAFICPSACKFSCSRDLYVPRPVPHTICR
jgi:hypothetical protein